jgi:hypothetical protein
MTEDEIRKLLGGYATDALSADERRILFEAALDDQELFNALQNEDALHELLADPVARDQVRRALARPIAGRPGFWSRRWVFGVAIPALAAVTLIVLMNRANAPRLIAPPVEIASSPAPRPAPLEPAAPEPAPVETKPQAKQYLKAQPLDRVARAAPSPSPAAAPAAAPAAIPRLALPSPAVQREATGTAMASLRVGAPPEMPAAVRQQFSAGFAANVPLYLGPLVRYSVVRSGPAGDDIRVQVTTGLAGYLALYQVDAAGNSKRVYPLNDVAAPVLTALTIQIPATPIKASDAKDRLRLVVIPLLAPAAQSVGTVGGVVNGAVNKDASPFPASAAPLVVDIPLGPN